MTNSTPNVQLPEIGSNRQRTNRRFKTYYALVLSVVICHCNSLFGACVIGLKYEEVEKSYEQGSAFTSDEDGNLSFRSENIVSNSFVYWEGRASFTILKETHLNINASFKGSATYQVETDTIFDGNELAPVLYIMVVEGSLDTYTSIVSQNRVQGDTVIVSWLDDSAKAFQADMDHSVLLKPGSYSVLISFGSTGTTSPSSVGAASFDVTLNSDETEQSDALLITWPNGEVASSTTLRVNGISIMSDDDGVLLLNEVQEYEAGSSRDYVVIEVGSEFLELPLAEALGEASQSGDCVYVIDLCPWARSVIQAIEKIKEELKDAIRLERAIRDVIEVEYEIVQRGDWWNVEVQTSTVKTIETLEGIVKSINSKDIGHTLANLNCSLNPYIDGPLKLFCELINDVVAKTEVIDIAISLSVEPLTRDLVAMVKTQPNDRYSSVDAAKDAINDIRSRSASLWDQWEPHYIELVNRQAKLQPLWEALSKSALFLREKSSSPNMCIPQEAYNVIAFPLEQPELSTKPEYTGIKIIPSAKIRFLLYLARHVLPDDGAFFPFSSGDNKVVGSLATQGSKNDQESFQYKWYKIDRNGITHLGDEEFFVIESFSEENAGQYQRIKYTLEGVLVETEVFGIYPEDESVQEPDIFSESQILIGISGSNVTYTSSISSSGITGLVWSRNGTILDSREQSIRLDSLSKENEGDYAIHVSNAGGRSSAEQFRLYVIEEPIDRFILRDDSTTLSIFTEPNFVYGIETSAELLKWTDIGETTPGNGNLQTIEIPEGKRDQFYRVKVTPNLPLEVPPESY